MIKNKDQYFDIIGLTNLFRDRANEVIDFYQNLYPNQLKTVFISEYIDSDGNRNFKNLWLLTNKHICEAKNFLKEDDFDSVTIKNSVKGWLLKKKNYDFKIATQKSRMTLNCFLSYAESHFSCSMKASGENCGFLRDLLKEYIIPNEIGEL